MGHWSYALQNIGMADIADIVLVGFFLFVLIDWLRHHVSFRGLAIFAILILVEIAALEFNLYLTRIMAQVALALLIIIWLVVFQSDIRRTVDRIAIWGATRRPVSAESPLLDLLTQSAAEMAERRMGALICLRGDEPWDRHIEGGVRLNGRVSFPLLISIFSTTTPGHDGAMLIEGDEIVRFAAHLPLSSNQSQIAEHGTRHAAAIGLTEVCDALVIVVSEEHGTISVADHGMLTRVSPAQLKASLESFLSSHGNHHARVRPAWWRSPVFPILLVSLAIALVARLSLFMAEPVYRTFAVPVELRRVPPQLHIVDPPMQIKLTLAGTENAFRLLNTQRLAARIDLEKLDRGVSDFKITEDNLNLPEALTLVQSDPPILHITAQPR